MRGRGRVDCTTKNLTNLNAIEREFFEGVPKGKTFECKRIELNALTANQLIDYIDGGIARAIAENGLTNKIVPPEIVLTDTANQLRHDKLMHNVKTALIEKYGIEQQARQIVEALRFDDSEGFTGGVADYLESNALATWRDGLEQITDKQIAANQGVIIGSEAVTLSQQNLDGALFAPCFVTVKRGFSAL